MIKYGRKAPGLLSGASDGGGIDEICGWSRDFQTVFQSFLVNIKVQEYYEIAFGNVKIINF